MGSGKGCRYHGAHKPNMAKRCANHPRYRHGGETLDAKAKRSRRLADLRYLEALSFSLGLAVGSRWRGRKPACIVAECSAPPGGTRDTNEGYGRVRTHSQNRTVAARATADRKTVGHLS